MFGCLPMGAWHTLIGCSRADCCVCVRPLLDGAVSTLVLNYVTSPLLNLSYHFYIHKLINKGMKARL